MNKSNQIKPLTIRHRIGYALGDFGGCMTFGLMTAFTTRYYINVAMIDTAVIAAMTLVWKLFDALANPFVGVMLDRSFAASGGKRDKFRPWILRMAPLLSLCAILVFTAPGWVDGMARLVVAFSTYLMYEAVYAIHVIAFAGLISGMAVTDDERVLRSSLLVGAGLYVGLFALHALTTVNIWVHIAWNAVASGMANLSNMMQWGMLGESIEYNEYLTGKRTEGSINGTFNMLRRAGQGLGAATGVALLGMIGYNAELTVQSSGTILGIKALCLLFPALCALGSWLVFRFLWNITPELRQKMAAARKS